ncbi:hypothetical protein BJV77DRAFT_1071892 [Russula vinacea]|nr:hypothetical protein BJV77DRAFT_1071892 [Russula vinacea]
MAIWITDSALFLLATIQLRSKWSPEASACVLTNFDADHATKYAVLGTLIADIALLLIMLIGLLRMRREGGGAFAMGRTLWKQGLLWLLLATVGETPSAVLLVLNLNSSLNLITQSPGMIIEIIAATRLYRSLTNIYSYNMPIPPNRMEVSVRTEYDQFPSPHRSSSGTYVQFPSPQTSSSGTHGQFPSPQTSSSESGLEEKRGSPPPLGIDA